jgi:toxic protein SymE
VRQHTRIADHNHYLKGIVTMTDRDCSVDSFDPEVLPVNKRELTVSYVSRYPDYQRIPALTMKGQWLEAAGFTTSSKVEVRVMEGCIVLTAKPQEPELEAALRQASKLSARKQKQIAEFIGVMGGKRR